MMIMALGSLPFVFVFIVLIRWEQQQRRSTRKGRLLFLTHTIVGRRPRQLVLWASATEDVTSAVLRRYLRGR